MKNLSYRFKKEIRKSHTIKLDYFKNSFSQSIFTFTSSAIHVDNIGKQLSYQLQYHALNKQNNCFQQEQAV